MKHLLLGIALLVCSSREAHSFPAKFGLSPDNSQGLLTSTIRSARKSVVMNVYELESPAVAQALEDRVKAGVAVQIMVEGKPAASSGLSDEAKKALKRVFGAMKKSPLQSHRIFVKSATSRFVYNHAKYVVVDEERVLVSTDNFKESGHPSAGRVGNRGWEVVVTERGLARELTDVFRRDSDPSYGDIEQPQDFPLKGEAPPREPATRTIPTVAVGQGEMNRARFIFSPNSLPGLRDLLRSAHQRIDVEFMDLPGSWKEEGRDVQNPLVGELVEAARRGAQVRVLLNKDFSSKDPRNMTAAQLLERTGRCQRIPLTARIVDTEAAGIEIIHNKGFLVDGRTAVVSSINGTRNSVMNNREVALAMESPDAARYFGGAFDFDWKVSPKVRGAPCALWVFGEQGGLSFPHDTP
jgi:cardiolipin synthase A/B